MDQLTPDDLQFRDELLQQQRFYHAKIEAVQETLTAYLTRKYKLVQGDKVDEAGRIVRAAPGAPPVPLTPPLRIAPDAASTTPRDADEKRGRDAKQVR